MRVQSSEDVCGIIKKVSVIGGLNENSDPLATHMVTNPAGCVVAVHGDEVSILVQRSR